MCFPPPAIRISFTPCLKHREITSLSFQESDVTPFTCALASPLHSRAKSGNEPSGTCALTRRVYRPAEPQTGCWLTRPSGRQHVWHHATCHIWQRWGGWACNDVCFSFSSCLLHLILLSRPSIIPFVNNCQWAFKEKKKTWICINDAWIFH